MKPNLISFVALAALVVAGCAGTGRSGQVAEDDIAGRALIAAAEQSRADVARFAIEQGADVDVRDAERGRTPLMLAAERGDLEMMTVLMPAGADVDARSEEGWTALIHAVSQGEIDAVELLLGADAEPARRLRSMKALYGFFEREMPALLIRWREGRDGLVDDQD